MSGVAWGKIRRVFKGLPITIGYHLRRFRPQQPDRRGAVQIFGQPHGAVRLGEPRKERSQPVPPDDGAASADPG